MENLFKELEELLKADDRLFSGNNLLKNKIVELALKMDKNLVKLLLSNSNTKRHFFFEIEEALIFDKDNFIRFVGNKNFLPDSFTEFKNKIGLTDNRTFISQKKDVVLTWPYKDCILEGGQTEERSKRNEIFWNETLAHDQIDRLLDPKVFTNFMRIDGSGEHQLEEIKDDDNLIINGNNLLVLFSLKKKFVNKIKLIYIDPPYNTGNDDFNYNDSFNHSTWLTFMKNRLEIARELLKDDGAIFISINHIELNYLKVLCDEIFGRNNFINLITIQSATTASYRSINVCPVNVSEYLLLYAKNKSIFKSNPIYVETAYSEDYSHFIENFDYDVDNWNLINLNDIIYESQNVRDWREFKNKFGEGWKEVRYDLKSRYANENREKIVSLNTLQRPSRTIQDTINRSKNERGKIFKIPRESGSPIYVVNGRTLAFYSHKFTDIDNNLVPSEILTNIWTDISFLSLGNEGAVNLPRGKKPEKLIERIIKLICNDNKDIILDFFLGSGTTAAVAHKLNIQYIGIEQLDYGDNSSIIRLKNVINGDQSGISKSVKWDGGGDFIYCELMKLNEIFVELINRSTSRDELNNIWEVMREKAFLSYRLSIKEFDNHISSFKDLSLSDQKRFLFDILDKNQLYVNFSEIEDVDYDISQDDKELNNKFYLK